LVLVTNFVFYRGAGGDDIRLLLQCASDNPKLDRLSKRNAIRKNIECIVQASRLPIDKVVVTLAKVRLEERKSGIDQPDLEVVQALGQIDEYSYYPHSGLLVAARLLKARVWEASSLAIDGAVLEQHRVTADFREHIAKLRITRKRIDGAELRIILASRPVSETRTELLTIANFLTRQEIPPGLGRMELKMAAGDISYCDVAQAKDDVATLESAFLHWKERHGLQEANRRLGHFQHLALRDARAALQISQRPDAPYGQAMLKAVRTLLAETSTKEASTLFGCRVEHLLGAAGLLTEECKIWWCPPRPTGEGDGNAP
jgi:hypothetical protein